MKRLLPGGLLLGALLTAGCNRHDHLVMVEETSELRAMRTAITECRRYGAIAQPSEVRDGTYVFRCVSW